MLNSTVSQALSALQGPAPGVEQTCEPEFRRGEIEMSQRLLKA